MKWLGGQPLPCLYRLVTATEESSLRIFGIPSEFLPRWPFCIPKTLKLNFITYKNYYKVHYMN